MVYSRLDAVDNYPHALKRVLEFYKTQRICDEAVDIYPFLIKFFPEYFVTEDMCDKIVIKCFFCILHVAHD